MPKLASFTAEHEGDYPQYISIGALGDHVSICVRSSTLRGQPGSFASIKMTRANFSVLLTDTLRALRG